VTERDRVAAYHLKQYDEMYRSTASIIEYVGKHIDEEQQSIIDVGCGAGADAHWLTQEYEDWNITGIDLNEELIELAREKNVENDRVHFETADFLELVDRYGANSFDHVFAIQFLTSAAFELTDFLDVVLELATDGVLVHSLFSEGWIEQHTRAHNLSDGWEGIYKVHSLKRLEEELETRVPSADLHYEKFDIDKELPKPDGPMFKTYTVQTESGETLQISGYMLMPWYTLYIDL
jgi:SAM-dependent methyltransferase